MDIIKLTLKLNHLLSLINVLNQIIFFFSGQELHHESFYPRESSHLRERPTPHSQSFLDRQRRNCSRSGKQFLDKLINFET